ncbi:mannose-1-phosphate guanylyltransferase/mannose-6-phosphate isomerase [Methylobacillus sp. MM3]|jgi:mannose-1-phosphate guanylyltransferase/mannose-6-phosphate isomerase|uniref:mannose-1-phosphate guanylyltransferase/mannose-6-phosphate isomerase n=1 Tax=Methylobacillus sp. MM3 TaxID=1848039 RepID=UPI0007E220E8|nr:mannose-1-phosphate guanylyltransferase/mannose-6-phosphate isomerase [Methylobacillus sp. MM3]OAJ71236.1 mannose-1-phosphate guanylyltransferase/mannose-6-phosphate isomerase [Methylobacillus sp. MM3]
MSTRYAVILSGGSGMRLWPLSRSLRPKQLLCLNGDRSLLQQTAERLLKLVAPSNLFTVTHQDHKFEVKGQLSELSANLVEGVLSEPVARNTLPAIAWAVHEISKRDPDAIIGVFPSDHAIENEDVFLEAWQSAESAAEEGYLTLIGLAPTEPATGYGYIQPGAKLDLITASQAHAVSRFVEKPDQKNAQKFVANGYLWNGGMFVFQASIFMEMLRMHQPEMFNAFEVMGSNDLSAIYQSLESLSMDYGIVEKAENVAVVPVAMGWSDLGSWDSIYQHQSKDDDKNLTHGNVLSIDTKDSLIWATDGLVATLGVSNLAVIQTADATLICDRSRSEDIKQLVTKLQQTHPHLTETHLTVHRPWGTYTVLEEGPNFKIKCITVNPGAKLSMQMHNHRSEHWVVVSGRAKITNGERELILEENESTYIPKTHHHRLENTETVPLQIIEVQCGDYVGEDDIVRFEDTYGRRITQ